MTDQNELLVGSYCLSAERILEALSSSRLTIQNSRKPNNPPNIPPGFVVGLCSQGGRHHYFDVPIRALQKACEDMAGLQGNADVSKLQSICLRLKRATSFHSDSGCVNDKVPRIVPLMPPEEIWLDGRQLPMDVWRLLSFDMDTLSAAIMSDIKLSDLSYGSLNFGALAFAKIVSQVSDRSIEFDLTFIDVDKRFISNSSTRFQCNLLQLFFEAGSLLTPLSMTEDFERWFLAIRYLQWLSKTSSVLKVKREYKAKKVDSRYRGLFSEEMAIGMMAVVLRERLGAIRINNTIEILDNLSVQRGGIIADFIALANDKSNNKISIVAESKGSLGKNVSKKRRDHAKEQVSNTRIAIPSAADTLNLVFSGNIYFDNQIIDTQCIVEDPPESNKTEFLYFDDAMAWRASYAKIFRFIGLENTAQDVFNGKPVEFFSEEDYQHFDDIYGKQRGDRYRKMGQIKEMYNAAPIMDVGPASVVIDLQVMRYLSHGLSGDAQYSLENYLNTREKKRRDFLNGEDYYHERQHKSFINSSGIGLVYYDDLSER